MNILALEIMCAKVLFHIFLQVGLLIIQYKLSTASALILGLLLMSVLQLNCLNALV